MNPYKSKQEQNINQSRKSYDQVIENIQNIKITDEQDENQQNQQSQSQYNIDEQQESQNDLSQSQSHLSSQQQSHSQIQQNITISEKQNESNQQNVNSNMNESTMSDHKSHNDSGIFFVTNPNFKSEKKQMTEEQFDKIQTNPEQYFDKQTEKISQNKTEILRNQAQIEESKSMLKRIQIQVESQINKDTRQIEIGIEQFIKTLTYNLQEQDQEMRYLQKQIDQQLADNQPTIKCLESFEKKVYRMEKEIGLVPEQQEQQQNTIQTEEGEQQQEQNTAQS